MTSDHDDAQHSAANGTSIEINQFGPSPVIHLSGPTTESIAAAETLFAAGLAPWLERGWRIERSVVPPQPERNPELVAAQDALIRLALRHPDAEQAVGRVLAMYGICSLRDAPADRLLEIAATAEAIADGLQAGARH